MQNSIFYNSKNLTQISKRGYYVEKILFFTNILEELANKQQKKLNILDVACNDGYLTKIYTKYGDVLGNDINPNSIKQCRRRGLQCVNSDIEDLPKRYHESFDVIIAGDIIEHIFNTDAFLKRIFALLKGDGILLLTTPNLASLGRRAMLLFGYNPYIEYSCELPTKDFNVGHIRYYTYNNLLNQLKSQKFTNIRIYGDRINLTETIHLPLKIAWHLPKISRNLMVVAQKSQR